MMNSFRAYIGWVLLVAMILVIVLIGLYDRGKRNLARELLESEERVNDAIAQMIVRSDASLSQWPLMLEFDYSSDYEDIANRVEVISPIDRAREIVFLRQMASYKRQEEALKIEEEKYIYAFIGLTYPDLSTSQGCYSFALEIERQGDVDFAKSIRKIGDMLAQHGK